ncbi:hypothetical protein CYMTET_22757 [Cymbomonas tetramitiformis]|uniref:Uncharacterized protein n=1 Tax=Cymbomonas tetramitiformis TaxID=36881 RepID=A0AAE0G051_9CHLO|nr:hypothetical protein CYMTET_46430 [Cymbomonas tetramitiformis]KAK3268755.1 hypothetical protein CYMTET_22757 [Cymbomonas tetramitiformis]
MSSYPRLSYEGTHPLEILSYHLKKMEIMNQETISKFLLHRRKTSQRLEAIETRLASLESSIDARAEPQLPHLCKDQ